MRAPRLRSYEAPRKTRTRKALEAHSGWYATFVCARRATVLKLSKRIQHRGPDWSSLHADGENFLAHQARRRRGHTGKCGCLQAAPRAPSRTGDAARTVVSATPEPPELAAGDSHTREAPRAPLLARWVNGSAPLFSSLPFLVSPLAP